MNEDHPPAPDHRGWLERLGKSLLGEPADREQLLELLRNAQKRRLLDLDILHMIEGALQVADMKVRDIMIPRAQMVTLHDTDTLADMLRIIGRFGHSRFPVVSEKKGKVIGIVLAKDLLRYMDPAERERFDLADVLRPAVFIPESKRLNVLLNEFRNSRNHMAIVVDEYGEVAGLITIEDVLEQIVGEIGDEHDVEEVEHAILARDDGHYTVKALTPIEDFNAHFGVHFADDDFDTVGGMVAARFGYVPKPGEHVRIDGFDFKVLKADSRRIHLLEVTRQPLQVAAG